MSEERNHQIKQSGHDLTACLNRTNPSEQFRATLLLTFVGMQFSNCENSKPGRKEAIYTCI
jgi:hypothetical protein